MEQIFSNQTMSANHRKRTRKGEQNPLPKKRKPNGSPPTSTVNFPNIWKRLSQINTSSHEYDHSSDSSEQEQSSSSSSDNERLYPPNQTPLPQKRNPPGRKSNTIDHRREQSSSDEDDIQSLSDDIALTSEHEHGDLTLYKRTPAPKLSEQQEVFQKYGYPQEKESCFACSWGRCPTNATSDLRWNGLIKLYQEKVGRCRRLELCENIHEYYENYLRNSSNLPEWSIPMIHEHFFKHVKDLRVVLPQIQGDLANIMRDYVNYMGEYDEEGNPVWMSNPKIITQVRVAANIIRGMSKDIGPTSSSLMLPEAAQNVYFVDYQSLGSVSDSISY